MRPQAKNPKVSVCVVTYNHEKYIGQCLQSIVDQQVDFPFEIVVGDDLSTDGTRAVIQDFADRYPGIVKPIFQPRNIGATNNYLAVHSAASGEYIAHLDGDDYALPGKLAALARALDERPDVNVVWHRMKVLDKSGGIADDLIDIRMLPRGGFTRRDLLACGTVGAHSAKMYRARMRDCVDSTLEHMMDYYLSVEHTGDGKAIWIDGFYGVYRRGVGVLVTHDRLRRQVFNDHLLFLLSKHKDCRKEINALALLLLLADIKNMRNSHTFNLWRKSFHVLSIFEFIKRVPLYRILRLPKQS